MDLLQHEGLPFQLEIDNDRHFFRYPNGTQESAGRNEVLLFAILVRLEKLYQEQQAMKLQVQEMATELQEDDSLSARPATSKARKPAAP